MPGSYNKNKLKLKSKHYRLLFDSYKKIIDCLVKAKRYDDAVYCIDLNVYSGFKIADGSEKTGDFYAGIHQKRQAHLYYKKALDEVSNRTITQLRDYDPYEEDYFKKVYESELKNKKKTKKGLKIKYVLCNHMQISIIKLKIQSIK